MLINSKWDICRGLGFYGLDFKGNADFLGMTSAPSISNGFYLSSVVSRIKNWSSRNKVLNKWIGPLGNELFLQRLIYAETVYYRQKTYFTILEKSNSNSFQRLKNGADLNRSKFLALIFSLWKTINADLECSKMEKIVFQGFRSRTSRYVSHKCRWYNIDKKQCFDCSKWNKIDRERVIIGHLRSDQTIIGLL